MLLSTNRLTLIRLAAALCGFAPVRDIHFEKLTLAVTFQLAPQLALTKNVKTTGSQQPAFRSFVVFLITRQTRHRHHSKKGILLNLWLFFVAAHIQFDRNLQHPTINALDIQSQPSTACIVVFRAFARALLDGLIL